MLLYACLDWLVHSSRQLESHVLERHSRSKLVTSFEDYYLTAFDILSPSIVAVHNTASPLRVCVCVCVCVCVGTDFKLTHTIPSLLTSTDQI